MTNRARYACIALAFFMLAMLLAPFAFADNRSGDELTNTLDANTEVLNNIAGSDTIALAGSNLGDVDIGRRADCLASTQFSIFVLFARQGLVLDLLCVARSYDEAGKYELAAQLRCGVPEIGGLDYTGTTCIEANNFGPGDDELPAPTGARAAPETTGLAAVSSDLVDAFEDEEEDDAAVADHDEYEQAIAQLRREFEADQAARRRAAQRAAQKRQEEAQAIDEFLYSYEQLTEQAQQIEEPPATEEPPSNEQ